MTQPHDFQGIVTKLRTTKGSPFALDVMKEAADAIDRVLELHRPYRDDDGFWWCAVCDDYADDEFVCTTRRALGASRASASSDT